MNRQAIDPFLRPRMPPPTKKSSALSRPVAFSHGGTMAAGGQMTCLVVDSPPPLRPNRGSGATTATPQEQHGCAAATDMGPGGEAASVIGGNSCAQREQQAAHGGSTGSQSTSDDPLVATPAPFLFADDGTYLADTYGLGHKMVREMGWRTGSGLGRGLVGRLEPISAHILGLATMHFGRKDRRCIGLPAPKKFIDSDASDSGSISEERGSRGPRTRADPHDQKAGPRGGRLRRSRSISSRRSGSSGSSWMSKKPRRSMSRSKKPRRSLSRSGSRSSRSRSRHSSSTSSSSSSGSARRRRRCRSRSTRMSSGPARSGFPTAPGTNAAAPQPAAPVKEPPEIALAKKQVLAKLTVLKNVEPKEQRAKEFRLLLREWHPDKNQERIDMATAVFQFLQKGKSLLNLK